MKKNKILALVLSAVLLLNSSACVSSQTKPNSTNKTTTTQSIPKENNKLSEKQVLEKIKQNVQKVSSVTSKYKIKVSELDANNKEKSELANYNIDSKIIFTGKDKDGYPNIEQMYDKTTTTVQGKTSNTQSYVNTKTKKAYYDPDGKGMKEYLGTELKTETESSYMSVIKMMIFTKTNQNFVSDTNKQLRMAETNDAYIFAFNGKNGDLLYALDGLFGLGIDTNNLQDVEIEMSYKISKKDFSLVEVVHKTVQTSEGKKLKSEGTYTVNALNDIKQIAEASNLK